MSPQEAEGFSDPHMRFAFSNPMRHHGAPITRDLQMTNAAQNFDPKNAEILADRVTLRDAIDGPRVGDFIITLDGTLKRFTYEWNDGLQTTWKGTGGSFYLGEGYVSFSGGLNPSIPFENIEATDETRNGSFWFFDLDIRGAGRGVDVETPCRVYKQIA